MPIPETADILAHGVEPWTNRVIPCWLEWSQLYCFAGPASWDAPLVARSEADAARLRELGYWRVEVATGVER